MSFTDYSGSIIAGGTSQQLMPAAPFQQFVRIQNTSRNDLWYKITGPGAAIGAPGSYRLAPGASYENKAGGCPTALISIIGATTGQTFAAISVVSTTLGASIIDRSGTLGTSSLVVFAQNPNRVGYCFQNITQQTIYYTDSSANASIGGGGNYRLAPGAYLESESGIVPVGPISFVCSVSSLSFSAGEW